MNVLDWGGVAFLKFFAIAWLGMLLVGFAVHELARRRSAVPSKALRTLNPSTLGFLAGGDTGAVRAAVAGLEHQGRVTVQDTGVVEGVQPIDVTAGFDPVSKAILRELRNGPVTISALEGDARHELDDERVLLTEMKLVLRPVFHWLPSAGLIALLVIGLAKIVVGMARGRPVTLLILACAICFGTAAWLNIRSKRAPQTIAGLDGLKALCIELDALELTAKIAPKQLSGSDMAMATALWGGHLIVGTGLAAHLARSTVVSSSHSSNASIDFFSSCSSCGGGCGGCGA